MPKIYKPTANQWNFRGVNYNLKELPQETLAHLKKIGCPTIEEVEEPKEPKEKSKKD